MEGNFNIYLMIALLLGWIVGHFITSKMIPPSPEEKCGCGCDGSCSLPSSYQIFDEDMSEI